MKIKQPKGPTDFQPGQSYRTLVNQRFRKNRLALWSLRVLYIFLFIAIFADFIANDKPIYCKIDGAVYFPVLKQYAVDLGLSSWESKFLINDWDEQEYEAKLMPLIPYRASNLDMANSNYVSPFADQRVAAPIYHHRLGTDMLGRDVAAGMVSGTRIAMLVGILAMSIAGFIGILLGALAGYFGDNGLKISIARLALNIIGLFLGVFYGFIVRSYAIDEGSFGIEIVKSMGLFIAILLLVNLISSLFRFVPFLRNKITIPVDLFVMRAIETLNAIPSLLLILAIVALIEKPSIFYVMIIIGCIRWTGIARFVRAELLKVRKLNYIEAAKAMGFSDWRILFRHALPNALTPVLISIAFGIAGAILLEAFLSFLGIGIPPESVSWGSMLQSVRGYPQAWWLAIFPGMAIFITVTIFNLIGEGLTEAMDPKADQEIAMYE